MDADDDKVTVQVQERGFEGHVIIDRAAQGRIVRVSGSRPQDGADVVKDVPADRDAELEDLARRVVDGDEGAAPRLLAHLGVLDPPLPDDREVNEG